MKTNQLGISRGYKSPDTTHPLSPPLVTISLVFRAAARERVKCTLAVCKERSIIKPSSVPARRCARTAEPYTAAITPMSPCWIYYAPSSHHPSIHAFPSFLLSFAQQRPPPVSVFPTFPPPGGAGNPPPSRTSGKGV